MMLGYLFIFALLLISVNAACSDHSTCGACVNDSDEDCSFCAESMTCTNLLCPDGETVVTVEAACPVTPCAAAPAEDYCLFGESHSILNARASNCAAVNNAPAPTRVDPPTFCSMAKEEPSCANLIRSLGCSYNCQACNATIPATRQICRNTCQDLIEKNCSPTINTCLGSDDPFQFICSTEDENCINDIIPSRPLPPPPTLAPEPCVPVSPPSMCQYDASGRILTSLKPLCDIANMKPIEATTNPAATEVPESLNPCTEALMSDVWCDAAIRELQCSRRCQFCESGANATATFDTLQVCPDVCEVKLAQCFSETLFLCRSVIAPLCAIEGMPCTNTTVSVDVTLPPRPTTAPPTPAPPTTTPTTVATTTSTAAPETTSTAAPEATTTAAPTTTTPTTTATDATTVAETTAGDTTTVAPETTEAVSTDVPTTESVVDTTAPTQASSTIASEASSTTVAADTSADVPQETERETDTNGNFVTFPETVQAFFVPQEENDIRLGVGIGVTLFVLCAVFILVWACAGKRQE